MYLPQMNAYFLLSVSDINCRNSHYLLASSFWNFYLYRAFLYLASVISNEGLYFLWYLNFKLHCKWRKSKKITSQICSYIPNHRCIRDFEGARLRCLWIIVFIISPVKFSIFFLRQLIQNTFCLFSVSCIRIISLTQLCEGMYFLC